MAFGLSLLDVVSTRFQRISAFLAWYLFLSQVDAQNRSSEVDILVNFKTQMQLFWIHTDIGGNFGIMTNSKGYWSTWNDMDDNPCGWEGVTCNDANLTLELNLSGWELQYLLPSWEPLSGLRDLQKLDLSFNYFGSDPVEFRIIPPDIQSLTALTHLDLSSSGFQGAIPPNISACTSLQYISLEHNQLSGEIPSLGDLVNLKLLLLGSNQLTGEFPLELGQITSLVTIDLSDNMLYGTLPVLSNLSNLLHLKLDNNSFTEFEGPLFPGAKNVEELSISRNQLEGVIPSGITNLPNLKVLNMSHNRLSGDIPSDFYLAPSPYLRENRTSAGTFSLDLSDNQLTGTISTNVLQLALLMTMNLSHNLLTGINTSLDERRQLFYDVLDVSDNNLSGLIPPLFTNQSSIINSLCLQNNLLSGDIMDFLLQNIGMYRISELRLGNNFFTGDLSRFADSNYTVYHGLQVLDISNNYLGMKPTEGINPLSGVLHFLMQEDLGCHLKEFYAGGNNFSGSSPPANFSGNISASSCLEVLDLSGCHLTGEISGAAFNTTWLPSLRFLNLSNNEANGSIPESIFMIPNLEVLDVSNNKLSGQLPYIPLGNKLYNPTFYSNNSGLCGEPLSPCGNEVGMSWWVALIVAGSLLSALGSCLVTTWRWRVYQKRHQQDADLIKTLLEGGPIALMSLREIRIATDNFAKSAQIGEGGFGIVYKGRLNSGTIVAIKKSKHVRAQEDKQLFLNEVRILSQISHRHLVKLLGCCMENKIALLVFEFIGNGTLQEYLEGKVGGVRLNWNQRMNIAIQVANALHYLHSMAEFPIYHRDVKSANVLLDSDLNAKVSDFGISRLAPVQATYVSTIAVQGTFGYMDPEYYTSLKYTDKSDVYSFGVVLLELISAKPAIDPCRGEDESSLVIFALRHIKSGDLRELLDPTLMETYNNLAGQGRESILSVGRLAMRCLEMRPKARPRMDEVWKELQNIWAQLSGTSEHLDNIHEDLPVDEETVFDFECLTGKPSKRHNIHNDASAIQMLEFCVQVRGEDWGA